MIPSKVKVAGIEYDVLQKPTVDKNATLAGICNWGFSEIEIKEDIPQDRKEETFIHELLHAIHYEAGYDTQDEDMINRVGKVLYQVLKDNDLRFGNKGKQHKMPRLPEVDLPDIPKMDFPTMPKMSLPNIPTLERGGNI
ncbi:hypothetical protein QGM71_01220 [Virgibacillus sp. C22-A2]|uniref:Phage protein n=1 Tax=Virgibacillus tibetensis TaxID=3042313 RepID=A0ABU6K9U3_9BACI|nr:hypothetical protein [Virgibacillus sp. C22-A2]